MPQNQNNKNLEQLVKTLKGKIPEQRATNIIRPGEKIIRTEKVKLRTFSVCWGIPMDELCYSLWFSNFIHLPIMPWDNITIPMSTYLPEARNIVHNSFLDMDKECEWLAMLDSDVIPPPDFLDRLLDHNLQICGGWYRNKGKENKPVVYDGYRLSENGRYTFHQVEQPGKGLMKVAGAGAGCWLMHRTCAEKLGRSPYSMERTMEDFELCLKLHERNIPIWIDWDIACAHAGVGIT